MTFLEDASVRLAVARRQACASVGALGGEMAEEQFLGLAREAFRRAHANVTGAGASA